MFDQIPTLLQPKRIELANGRAVKIRRAKRAQRERIINAGTAFSDGTTGSALMTIQYATRWGVVAIEGFTQPSGELEPGGTPKSDRPVEFKVQTHPLLGAILAEEIYDTLTDDDVDAIAGEVVPELTRKQVGN